MDNKVVSVDWQGGATKRQTLDPISLMELADDPMKHSTKVWPIPILTEYYRGSALLQYIYWKLDY